MSISYPKFRQYLQIEVILIKQNDEAINTIINALEQYVDCMMSKAHFDRTIRGVITAVQDGIYSVRSGKETYSIKSETVYSVGDTVYILIAQNDQSNKLIIGKVV